MIINFITKSCSNTIRICIAFSLIEIFPISANDDGNKEGFKTYAPYLDEIISSFATQMRDEFDIHAIRGRLSRADETPYIEWGNHFLDRLYGQPTIFKKNI